MQEKRKRWEIKAKKVLDSDFHRISDICVLCWIPAKQPYTVNYLKEETYRDLLSLALSEKKQLAGCVAANTQSSVFKAEQAKQEYDELLFLRSSLRKWRHIKLTKHGWTEFSLIWDNLRDKKEKQDIIVMQRLLCPLYLHLCSLLYLFSLVFNGYNCLRGTDALFGWTTWNRVNAKSSDWRAEINSLGKVSSQNDWEFTSIKKSVFGGTMNHV